MTVRFALSRPDAVRLRWRIDETRRRSKDVTPAWLAAETPVRKAIGEWFDAEGRGWVPLAPKTVLARRNRWGYYRQGFREGPTGRILHARHVLRQSLTETGGRNASDPTARRWTFGSRVRYAGLHHLGAAGLDRSPLPARPLVPLDDTLPGIVLGAIRVHVLWPWRQRGPWEA